MVQAMLSNSKFLPLKMRNLEIKLVSLESFLLSLQEFQQTKMRALNKFKFRFIDIDKIKR